MSLFGAKSVQPAKHDGTFCFKVDAITMDNVVLAYGYHGDGSITAYETADYYWQGFAMNGTCVQSSIGANTLLDTRNWSVLHLPQQMLSSSANEGYQQFTAKLRAAAVRRVLGSLIGSDVSELTIISEPPPTTPALLAMRRKVFSLAWELDSVFEKSIPATLKELEQSIILRFLLAYHHNYSDQLFVEPKSPSARELAVVEEYISANWDKPLEIDAIAEECGVSARSIFRYFRERRGCSPSAFIRRIRLEHARQELLKGTPQTSVVGVALSCGFASLGHFAKNYRESFGENPSETLKLAPSAPSASARLSRQG